jgi:hypothetical protein
MTRKGGIASGEARRKKKTFKEIIERILEESTTYNGTEVTKKELISLKALNYLLDTESPEKLDVGEYVKAWSMIRDTIGEKPIDRVDMSVSQESKDKLDQLSALIDE